MDTFGSFFVKTNSGNGIYAKNRVGVYFEKFWQLENSPTAASHRKLQLAEEEEKETDGKWRKKKEKRRRKRKEREEKKKRKMGWANFLFLLWACFLFVVRLEG